MFKKIFAHKSWKKSCIIKQLGGFFTRFFLCSPECPKQSRLHFHFTNYFITISVRIPECNLVFNFLTLLFSTNRQKRRFLLPYECCMFCSLYSGKWQSKGYTYTQNTCPLETEEQKDWPLSWNAKYCLILLVFNT